MWCIGELTAEYRRRMYGLLDLYARPHDPREPVICVDEKSKQLLRETRCPLPAKMLVACAGEQAILTTEVAAWQRRRNAARCGIEWTFTRRDSDRKLSRHYVS